MQNRKMEAQSMCGRQSDFPYEMVFDHEPVEVLLVVASLTDSLQLIQVMRKSTEYGSSLGLLVDDIRALELAWLGEVH